MPVFLAVVSFFTGFLARGRAALLGARSRLLADPALQRQTSALVAESAASSKGSRGGAQAMTSDESSASERGGPEFPDEIEASYEVREELGRGGQGVAYLAEERESGDSVVVKWLSLPFVDDWKSVELFHREAEVLRQLDHPRIPAYRDEFAVGDQETSAGSGPEFYLVQSYVDGPNLETALASGERWEADDLEQFLEEMLEVLAYLQGRHPPVVHRDLKPSNIVRDAAGAYHLVDFGSVQEKLASDRGGSTFVGTSGFMPPEQLGGRSEPASDLYALGMTAVQLHSGVHPSDVPVEGMVPLIGEVCDLPEGLFAVLERMTAPQLDRRFEDAEAALQALRANDRVAATDSQDTPDGPEAEVEFPRRGERWGRGPMPLYLLLGAGVILLSSLYIASPGGDGSTSAETVEGEVAEFSFAIAGEPSSLDPAKFGESDLADRHRRRHPRQPGRIVVHNLFEGLLRPARSTEGADAPEDFVRPGVAEDWRVSDDGTTYTFELRPDAKWSDGTPVTAQNFVSTWRKTFDPDFHVPLAHIVEGVERYNDRGARLNPLKQVDREVLWDEVGVEAIDRHTLQIELTHPAPYFPELVASLPFFPRPMSTVREEWENWTDPEHIRTNGAYTLESHAEGERLVLEKNEAYWNAEAVEFDRVEVRIVDKPEAAVRAFENGELDWTGVSIAPWRVPDYADDPRLRSEGQLGTYYVHVPARDELSAFADPRFVRALDLAVDREELIDTRLGGAFEPAWSMIPHGMPGFESKVRRGRDPGRARQLLDELGFKNGEYFPPLEYVHDGSRLDERVAGALEATWEEELGVEVETVAKDPETFLRRQEVYPRVESENLLQSEHVVDYADAASYLGMWTSDKTGFPDHESPDGPRGLGLKTAAGWSNARYDELVEEAKRLRRSSERREKLRVAESILVEKGPVVPLFFLASHTLLDRRIEGFAPHHRGLHLVQDLSANGDSAPEEGR